MALRMTRPSGSSSDPDRLRREALVGPNHVRLALERGGAKSSASPTTRHAPRSVTLPPRFHQAVVVVHREDVASSMSTSRVILTSVVVAVMVLVAGTWFLNSTRAGAEIKCRLFRDAGACLILALSEPAVLPPPALPVPERTESPEERVNDGRKRTPFRRSKTDPLGPCSHAASSLGTLPRSRSLSR
jgi:hypothetical protein